MIGLGPIKRWSCFEFLNDSYPNIIFRVELFVKTIRCLPYKYWLINTKPQKTVLVLMCWHGYLNHKCINTSSGKKFIQLAVTKADLINLEFGERNLRKNQLQISHFLSDELDENSGQQPQSVPLFLSNKFWCCFYYAEPDHCRKTIQMYFGQLCVH